MPSFAGLTKFFGRTASEGAAFAAGLAVSPALSPVVREIVNEANATYSTHPLSAGDAAAIVAEDVEQYDFGKAEASYNGVSEDRFKALLGEALNAPGVPELLVLWRRGAIEDADFLHGLRKAKLETRWDTPLETLKDARLAPADVTLAIQRRVMTDPGYLIDPPPIDNSNVPPMPVSPLDTTKELRAGGYDDDRAAVETRLRGIPPAPGELMQMLNRGVINEDAFNLGVVEGDTRQEWASFLIQLRRRLLTPHEYEEAALRGVISNDEADAGAALSGMEHDDARLLFEILGRPLNVHAITTGLARGATLGGTYDDVPEPYRDAIRRSNIRPEYARLSYANRFTYPSLFQLNNLVKASAITADTAKDWATKAGLAPEVVDAMHTFWAGEQGAKPAVSATSAVSRAARGVLSAYTSVNITKAKAEADLTELQVTADEQTALFAAADVQREAKLQGLSNTQIRNAYRKAAITEAEGLALLEAHGMTAAEATTYLTA